VKIRKKIRLKPLTKQFQKPKKGINQATLQVHRFLLRKNRKEDNEAARNLKKILIWKLHLTTESTVSAISVL
jgi:hypothetical protein